MSVENLPYIVRRQLVYFRTTYPAGTIVIAKSQHFLYVVKPNSAALRYTIGIGPDCSKSIGLYRVSRKTSEPETTSASGAQERRPTPVALRFAWRWTYTLSERIGIPYSRVSIRQVQSVSVRPRRAFSSLQMILSISMIARSWAHVSS